MLDTEGGHGAVQPCEARIRRHGLAAAVLVCQVLSTCLEGGTVCLRYTVETSHEAYGTPYTLDATHQGGHCTLGRAM